MSSELPESIDPRGNKNGGKLELEGYGVWQLKKKYGKEYFGVERSTFIINPSGKVAAIFRRVKVKGHIDEVKARLKEIHNQTLRGEEGSEGGSALVNHTNRTEMT